MTASVARAVPGVASLTSSMVLGGRRVPHRAVGRRRAFAWHDSLAARAVTRRNLDVVHAWPGASRRTLTAARAKGVAGLREVPNTHTAHAYAVVAEEVALLGLQSSDVTAHTFNARRLANEEAEWAAASALLVPSDAVAKTFTDRGFDASRLLRHQYGYRPTTKAPVARVANTGRPLTAVFVGRGEPRKGLHYALRAWRASTAHDKGTFIVCGEIDPLYRRYLELDLDVPGLELRGFQSDVASVFAEADVLLLPTIEEGSALVTYEAQAYGCVPLVSSAAGAVLTHDVEGLVHAPRDVTTLAGHLDALDADRSKLARMSAAAIAHAPQLTWSAANIKLVQAYDRARHVPGGAHDAVHQ